MIRAGSDIWTLHFAETPSFFTFVYRIFILSKRHGKYRIDKVYFLRPVCFHLFLSYWQTIVNSLSDHPVSRLSIVRFYTSLSSLRVCSCRMTLLNPIYSVNEFRTHTKKEISLQKQCVWKVKSRPRAYSTFSVRAFFASKTIKMPKRRRLGLARNFSPNIYRGREPAPYLWSFSGSLWILSNTFTVWYT